MTVDSHQPTSTGAQIQNTDRLGASKGLFLTFEGIDGAGKSSHINTLAQAFRNQGRQVTLTREPGGTPLAEKLRTIVLNDAMDPLTEALLIFAGRRDHINQVISPALAKGDVVLCDRFTDATFAYQGAGRGFDVDVLLKLEQIVQYGSPVEPKKLLKPDATLWFDLPAKIAAQRLAAARVPDRFESQPQAFFDRVAGGYTDRAQAAPERFVRIRAELTPVDVWLQIQAALVQRGWLDPLTTMV
jgi:dTMP kinase